MDAWSTWSLLLFTYMLSSGSCWLHGNNISKLTDIFVMLLGFVIEVTVYCFFGGEEGFIILMKCCMIVIINFQYYVRIKIRGAIAMIILTAFLSNWSFYMTLMLTLKFYLEYIAFCIFLYNLNDLSVKK